MKNFIRTLIFCAAALVLCQFTGMAQEKKGDSEEISPQKVLLLVREDVTGKSGTNKVYTVNDPLYKMNRRVMLLRFDNRVGMSDGKYYSRGLFQDLDNNEVLDIDFYVGYDDKGTLRVLDRSIHSVGGKARYYYNSEGKKIPL